MYNITPTVRGFLKRCCFTWKSQGIISISKKNDQVKYYKCYLLLLRTTCYVYVWLVMVLTAGSLAQHLDASLCVALGLLQLALVGVGGRIRAANWRHQRWTVHFLAKTLTLGWVKWVALTHSTKPTEHSFTACNTGRERRRSKLYDLHKLMSTILALHVS